MMYDFITMQTIDYFNDFNTKPQADKKPLLQQVAKFIQDENIDVTNTGGAWGNEDDI